MRAAGHSRVMRIVSLKFSAEFTCRQSHEVATSLRLRLPPVESFFYRHHESLLRCFKLKPVKPIAKFFSKTTVWMPVLISVFQAHAVVLWSNFDPITVVTNGPGTDLLGSAVKRDDVANDTLYFKFHVEPISDETTEPYVAALELFEDDTERLGVGNALEAWAYSAFFPGAQSSGVPPAGYLDLRSARPDPNALAHLANYQCPRRGEAATIVFKVQYVPHGEDLVTVWLNPDLGPGANEMNQAEALTTRFNANASFDELRLRHGGNGGGWTFSDLAIATAFNDFVDSSSAQPGSAEANLAQSEDSLQFQSWLKNQGLRRVPVDAIQQTRDGYLWIAAGGAIMRFDGLRFVPLNVQTAETNFSTQTIFGDSQGALWAAVSSGLQRWQNQHATTVTINDGLPNTNITALNEDAQGNIWIGTTAGLAIWNNGRLVPLADAKKIRGRAITAIFKDRQGSMWLVAQGSEVFRFDHDHFISVTGDSANDWMTDIHVLLVDGTGRVWLAAGEDAVLCHDKDGWHHYRIPKRTTGSRVNALAEEPDGTIWAGGASGLFLFSNGKFTAVPVGSKLAGNMVQSLFVDHDGALWAGTDEGLNRLQHKCLFALGQGEGLGFGPVQGLAQVSPGVVWAARTGDGMYRWDGRSFSRLRAAGLSAHNSQANALLLAPDGVCWVASTGGLLRYKDPVAAADEVRWFELPGEDIISLAEDRDGSLWAGTHAGKLWQLREGKWLAQNSISISNSINAILPAPNGSVWIGTGGNGLICLDHNVATFFGKNAGLPSEIIRALYLDVQGALWVGTAAGLSCKRGDIFSNFTARDGLPDNMVSQILEDASGRLWLGTGQGIACLHKDQLAEFAAGKLETLHPKIFNHADGMPSEECTGGFCPAGLKSQSGLLWFPSTKGVAVIAPERWPVEKPLPGTVIDEILLDGVPVAGSDAAKFMIPPGKHRLELVYTGLRFDAPETIRFRYKLEGWDADWIDAGTSRSAVYNFVPPGQYAFRVISCNSDGNWASGGAEIRLIFARYFWQSWWFIGIASVALLSTVVSTVRLVERQKAKFRLKRLEQERALERERTRIAKDLHDEMGAKLCRISFLSEHARRDSIKPAEMQEQFKSISDDSREVLHSLDEIVWAVNPQNDTLEHVASYLAQFAQDYFSMTGVEFELVMPAQMPPHPVSSQVRHHLFLAVREALANILKHSAATHAKISMACENDSLQICVADNGEGFDSKTKMANDPRAKDTRDGLRNMTKRIADVGGKCFIESTVGLGTTVKFILPLKTTERLNDL
jgi:signal transduction histidine kinase/ligand-binding sensor domain-containing protein